jgi:hypothetical protein
MKKVIVLFNSHGGTSAQYDKVWDGLRSAGASNPKGLISHVGGAKPDGSWFVCDIWESEADFKEFGKVLMPIIAKSGLPAAEPIVFPAHYAYIGEKETVASL